MQSVNPRTVQKSSKIAIVAGNGDLPILVIEKCIQLGKPYFLIIIKDHGEDTMNKFKCDYILKLNQIGKAIKILKNNKINEIISTYENSNLTIKEGYNIKSHEILYNAREKILFSNQKSSLTDEDGNYVTVTMFQYHIKKNLWRLII